MGAKKAPRRNGETGVRATQKGITSGDRFRISGGLDSSVPGFVVIEDHAILNVYRPRER